MTLYEQTFSIRSERGERLNNPTIYVVAQMIDEHIIVQQGIKSLAFNSQKLGNNEEEISP